MAGRFTGMRHVRLKQDILTKTTKLVRAGLIPEEPWLRVNGTRAESSRVKSSYTTPVRAPELEHLRMSI